jgi:hypothetical protein
LGSSSTPSALTGDEKFLWLKKHFSKRLGLGGSYGKGCILGGDMYGGGGGLHNGGSLGGGFGNRRSGEHNKD